MCLLVLAWRDRPETPLLLLGNRDERYSRPSAPAAWWPDAPDLLGGRDLEAGGSWLGVTRRGRFAVVTNVREADPPTVRDLDSRGRLVADFLRGDATPERYALDLKSWRYAGFNLICGDRGSAWYASNRAAPRALAPGVYALSNATLDTPWPKVERLRARFAAARAAGEAALFALLADREPAPDDALPDTGLGLALERQLSAPFVATKGYGTRASYLLAMDASGQARFVERAYDVSARTQERDAAAPPHDERRFEFALEAAA